MADTDGRSGRSVPRKTTQLALSWQDAAGRGVASSKHGAAARPSRAKLTLRFGAIAASNNDA